MFSTTYNPSSDCSCSKLFQKENREYTPANRNCKTQPGRGAARANREKS
jgi:hypothetical protein